MAAFTTNIRQTVRDLFAELQLLRSAPSGGPPKRAGAEELAEILRAAPGRLTRGGIADKVFIAWGAGAIKSITIHAGQDQLGFAGLAVPVPPAVEIKNNDDSTIADIVVQFAVSGGGGTVRQGKVRTKTNGIATLGSWTLGARGDNALKVTAGNAFVFFTAKAVTQLTATTATDQTANVSSDVRECPTVKVTDYAGNPLQGVNILFTVTAGGGRVTNSKPISSNADGLASCGPWKLGAGAGANTVIATAGPLNVTFTAQGT